jgi:hypothetical protein
MRLTETRFAAAFAGATFAIFLLGYGVALAGARLPDRASGRMVVVFPPFTAATQAISSIAHAGGRPVDAIKAAPFIWTVYGERPGFVLRVKSQGAWVAMRNVPGVSFATGCLALLSRPLPQGEMTVFR